MLGPAVRQEDGTLRNYGAVPAKGAVLRMVSYRTGGGRPGNVARGALRILRTSIPYVTRVENRHPARGGVDAETIEEAKVRGPILLRTGNRAVTTEDYEVLAREAAPEIARVRAVAAGDGADAGLGARARRSRRGGGRRASPLRAARAERRVRRSAWRRSSTSGA